jgi:hypothetical protein
VVRVNSTREPFSTSAKPRAAANTARLTFSQDHLLSGLHAITKLSHIETCSSSLGENPLGGLLLLVNVMLYLFRQHLDLGVIEFLVWRTCD